jgi:hypothetical protein
MLGLTSVAMLRYSILDSVSIFLLFLVKFTVAMLQDVFLMPFFVIVVLLFPAKEIDPAKRLEDGTFKLTGDTGSLRYMAPGKYS